MSSTRGKAAKSNDDFIPEDVDMGSGNSQYLNKLPQGDTKVRICSKPIFGWEQWIDNKPVRSTLEEGEPSYDKKSDEQKPKKFMAMVVIDREDDNKLKIMTVTQQTIAKAIKALTANPDWGMPFSYDITINKKGESLKTKYVVTPSPKKPLGKDVIKEAEKVFVNLEALYEGEDPWNEETGEATELFFK